MYEVILAGAVYPFRPLLTRRAEGFRAAEQTAARAVEAARKRGLLIGAEIYGPDGQLVGEVGY